MRPRALKILVSGATTTVNRIAQTDLREYIGHLQTPQNGNDLQMLLRSGLPWACDNAAYSNPDVIKFWNMAIDVWEWLRFNPPLWVAVPDVVGNHSATLDSFHDWLAYWEYELGSLPFPLSFVLQNGATEDSIPWDQIDGVFVGGDDAFKLRGCHDLIDAAKYRNKQVHIGRVNSLARLKYAIDIGADTVDGSGFSKFAEVKLERALREIRRLERTGYLFAA